MTNETREMFDLILNRLTTAEVELRLEKRSHLRTLESVQDVEAQRDRAIAERDEWNAALIREQAKHLETLQQLQALKATL